METYPVDIDPEQVARWVKAECELRRPLSGSRRGVDEKCEISRRGRILTSAMRSAKI
jgi:hypothetical protein